MSSTRRQRRKNRPVLSPGQSYEGKVKKLYSGKGYGFIQPSNNAARISFRINDAPIDRQPCVKVDALVRFRVVKLRDGKLSAHIF